MQAVQPWLSIGRYRDTINPERLKKAGIGALLTFAQPMRYPNLPELFLPVIDGEPIAHHHFDEGLNFIEQHYQDYRVLVACGAGISRSATFCVAALHRFEGMPLVEAYRFLKEVYPPAMPHPALWKSLCEYFGEDYPWIDVFFGDD